MEPRPSSLLTVMRPPIASTRLRQDRPAPAARDRGYTLSGGEPVLEAEATLSHYVGACGTRIEEYGAGDDGDGATIEVTLYAGWARALLGLDIDRGVWSNVYPDGEDVNYVEFPLQIGRTFGAATFSSGVVWAPSQTGTGDEANTWVWTRAKYAPETWPVSLHALIEHEDGAFAANGKTDWRVGIEAPVGSFTLGLAWVDSDTEDIALVASGSGVSDLAASRQAAEQHSQAGDDAGGQQGLATGEVQTLAGLALVLGGRLFDQAVQAVDDAAIRVQRLALRLVDLAVKFQLAVAGQPAESVLDLALEFGGGAFNTLVGHGENPCCEQGGEACTRSACRGRRFLRQEVRGGTFRRASLPSPARARGRRYPTFTLVAASGRSSPNARW